MSVVGLGGGSVLVILAFFAGRAYERRRIRRLFPRDIFGKTREWFV